MKIEEKMVGSSGKVKVGRNEIEVEVVEHSGNDFLVRSCGSGKLFRTKALITYPAHSPVHANKTVMGSGRPMSILEAAARALRAQPAGAAFNVRELVELAVTGGWWVPSGAKTPDQTLYAAILRESASGARPRIVRSTQRGKFELNRKP